MSEDRFEQDEPKDEDVEAHKKTRLGTDDEFERPMTSRPIRSPRPSTSPAPTTIRRRRGPRRSVARRRFHRLDKSPGAPGLLSFWSSLSSSVSRRRALSREPSSSSPLFSSASATRARTARSPSPSKALWARRARWSRSSAIAAWFGEQAEELHLRQGEPGVARAGRAPRARRARSPRAAAGRP